ncbi:MAG: hypothetical protein U1E78_02415 [Gammaproteobacteria bacterium]
MAKDELILNPQNLRPHIVLLGAGASLAALPNGDKHGKLLPVMDNFVQVLELEDDLLNTNIDPSGNFEKIYSQITDDALKNLIENKIYNYFSNLELPYTVTDYDRLLLSLREKDAIFTFNSDPFLFDAYMRNREKGVTLPEIFFLHGNVRLLACPDHYRFGHHPGICDDCGKNFVAVPLLYPIETKDYQNTVNYTKVSWEKAQNRFTEAFTITIFGYGAPNSDVEAVDLLKKAWLKESAREMEHIEIIDNDKQAILANRWKSFAPTNHYHIVNNLRKSRLWRWPRRSCESLFYPMSQGIPCEAFPLPETEDHDELQKYIRQIASYE